jgi:nickel/cobalt exporter
VSGQSLALLAAAAGVGFGHAVLPDHWAPLAVLGRTRRYPPARVARLSGLAGTAHVLVSILLGAAIVAVGLRFRAAEQGAQETIVGALLIITGLGYALAELSGHGRSHGHEHGHRHEHPHSRPAPAGGRRRRNGLVAVMVPFGAAASPDLTILPVFLAASTVGLVTAVGALLVFAVVTIGTFVGLTLLAYASGHQLRAAWVESWGGALTALVLVLIGALVLVGLI